MREVQLNRLAKSNESKGKAIMLSFFEDYIKQLEGYNAEARQALQALPVEALDWSPGKGMNSMAVLAAHIAGSERYWIGDVAAGEPSGRERAAEFAIHGVGGDELARRLEEVIGYTRRTLAGFGLDDLERICRVPGNDEQVSVASALLHALNHAALHVGHMQMTRQLWASRQGSVAT